MDLLHYFDQVDFEKFECPEWVNKKNTLGTLLQKNHEKLKPEKADIIIVTVIYTDIGCFSFLFYPLTHSSFLLFIESPFLNLVIVILDIGRVLS